MGTLYHLVGEAGVLQDEAMEKDFGVPDEKWKMGSSKEYYIRVRVPYYNKK